MSGIMNMLVAAKTAIATAVDEFFNRTTLLLSGNGTNGAQNNTFLDSSTNNFTITRNGNTMQGTFSPFSQTGWSTFFGLTATSTSSSISSTTLTVGGTVTGTFGVGTRISGTGITAGTYITALGTGTGGAGTYTINASHSLTARQIDGYSGSLRGNITTLASSSTSTFTIDFWYYPTSFTTEAAIIGDTDPLATSDYLTARVNTSGKLVLYWYDGGSKTCTGSTTLTLNAWNYCAVVVSSNAISLYVNSSTADTLTGTTTLTNRGGTLNYGIGKTTVSTFTEGYLSNIRVSTIARTISVPTAPFTSDADTRILVLTDNRFVAYGSVASTLTPSGLPSVQAFSPFAPTAAYSAATNGGSGYFDGNGDYVSAADNTALQLGSGDFTFEFYAYFPSGFSGTRWIGGKGDNSSASGTAFSLYVTGFEFCSGSTTYTLTTPTWVAGQWYHIAMVRNGTGSNNLKLYINGAVQSQASVSTNTINTGGSNVLKIGAYSSSASSSPEAYIADVRIVKGTAVYTAAFTPPTAPLTAITNTSLLLNFTNGGIIDATGKNVLETVGNAQISTTQSKFGGSSMSFDGSSTIPMPARQTLALGSGNWTIECWVRLGSTGTETTIGQSKNYYTAGFNGNFVFRVGTSNLWRSFDGQSSQATIDGTYSWSTGQWYHVAWVRNGSTVTVYRDGTSLGSTTDSKTLNDSANGITLGSSLNAYVDDLRITVGVARYTANFTAPTVAFPLS